MERRNFLMSAGALLIPGCAARFAPRGTYEPTEVPAPAYRAGDSWTYRRTDAYNGLARGILTRTVTSVQPQGIQIVTRDEHGNVLDDALFAAPGLQLAGTFSEDGPVIGRSEAPFRRYDFPLASGKAWSQSFYLRRTDPAGIRNYVTASMACEGWEDLRVGDRAYRALIVRRSYNLGPKTLFHGSLYRHETEWYVPALRGFARMHTAEQFYEERREVLAGLQQGDRFIYDLLFHHPA